IPPISPTTLLVAGSISMTLSPAALVCTIRTVEAWRAAASAIHPRTTESLVRMEEHSKLSRHVADPLFPARAADGRRAGAVDTRLRDIQVEGPAAAARETPRACALLCMPLHRYGISPAAPRAGPHRVHRRRNPQEFRDGEPLRRPGC